MLLQRRSRTITETAVDLTPMVDVVFQLLIFLMLTYETSTEPQVELPPAVEGTGVEGDRATILTMVSSGDPEVPVQVYRGMEVDPETLLETPEAIRTLVQDGLSLGRRSVVLQADGEVPHGEVIRIGGIISEVDGIVLHLGVQDPDQQ